MGKGEFKARVEPGRNLHLEGVSNRVFKGMKKGRELRFGRREEKSTEREM